MSRSSAPAVNSDPAQPDLDYNSDVATYEYVAASYAYLHMLQDYVTKHIEYYNALRSEVIELHRQGGGAHSVSCSKHVTPHDANVSAAISVESTETEHLLVPAAAQGPATYITAIESTISPGSRFTGFYSPSNSSSSEAHFAQHASAVPDASSQEKCCGDDMCRAEQQSNRKLKKFTDEEASDV